MIWKDWETSKTGLPTFMNTASYILNLLHLKIDTRHEFKYQDSHTTLEKTCTLVYPELYLQPLQLHIPVQYGYIKPSQHLD